MKCLRCKLLGCDMQPIPGARIVEPADDYGSGLHLGWRVLGPATACTRCHHYGGSEVCRGRRDGAPPIWCRWPRLYRHGGGWRIAFWWRGRLWIGWGETIPATLRRMWCERARWTASEVTP